MSNTHTHIRTDTKYIYISKQWKRNELFFLFDKSFRIHITLYTLTQPNQPNLYAIQPTWDSTMQCDPLLLLFFWQRKKVWAWVCYMYTEKKEKLHVVYNVYDVFVFLGGDINSTMLGGNIFFGMKLATIKTKN